MKHTIVYVDDDINLLKSFKRLLVNEDYDIQTFSDPHEALALDAGTAITLVISDFKMPIMNGIELLQQFKIKFPKAIRIMTTGFADLKTTIEAINKGEVYRYVNKPWNTSELKILIQQGIHLYEVSEKNIELQKLTQKQLEELKDFNENLEKKVEEKSREIVEKNKVLEKVNEKLDESFYESLRLILKIVEIKDPYIGNHSKRVSIIADLIAEEMDLEPEKKRDIKLGSFLHDIGKISLPDHVFKKSYPKMTEEEKKLYYQHPVIGNLTISFIPRLKEAAEIVLHHHEDYSGTGFPNGLKGEDISLGARILRIADAYDRMVNPAGDDAKQMTMDEAYRKIESDSIVLYDHNIVKKFKNVIDSLKIALREKKTISKITHEQLKEGMVIAADVKTVSGIFIFKKDEVVNSSMLERLKEYVKLDPLKEKISIYAKT